MSVFSYARVSTVRQDNSLALQGKQTSAYAELQGLSIDRAFVDDGVSGSVLMHLRPAGGELLAALEPGDTVIASKLDRMFRRALDGLNVVDDLKKQGVNLHFIDLGGNVTGEGIGMLVYTILLAVAEDERRRIRTRIRETKQSQKQRGHFLGGGRPFGYRVQKVGNPKNPDKPIQVLHKHKAEQAAIREIVSLRARGDSLRDISAAMVGGYKLSHQAVARILRDTSQQKGN